MMMCGSNLGLIFNLYTFAASTTCTDLWGRSRLFQRTLVGRTAMLRPTRCPACWQLIVFSLWLHGSSEGRLGISRTSSHFVSSASSEVLSQLSFLLLFTLLPFFFTLLTFRSAFHFFLGIQLCKRQEKINILFLKVFSKVRNCLGTLDLNIDFDWE